MLQLFNWLRVLFLTPHPKRGEQNEKQIWWATLAHNDSQEKFLQYSITPTNFTMEQLLFG